MGKYEKELLGTPWNSNQEAIAVMLAHIADELSVLNRNMEIANSGERGN